MKKQLLVFATVLSGFSATAQIPTNGLVGDWPFDGNANDYSGNLNNGTVYGASPTSDRFGNPNRAYSFDGVSSKIIVNNSATIDMTNSGHFTIAFWIKTASGNSSGIPLGKSNYGSFSGYQFFTNNTNSGYCNSSGALSFYTASGAHQDACANTAICNDNTNWYFITGVYNGSLNQSKLYVNAVVQTSTGQTSGAISNSSNLAFGAHPTSVNFFKGDLDGVRIYNRVLTDNEILTLYNEANPATTGINDLNKQGNSLMLFPNPAKDHVQLQINSQRQQKISVDVMDNMGKTLYTESGDMVQGNNELYIPLNDVANGIYLLKVHFENGDVTKKISVLK